MADEISRISRHLATLLVLTQISLNQDSQVTVDNNFRNIFSNEDIWILTAFLLNAVIRSLTKFPLFSFDDGSTPIWCQTII